ncbi:hypothetical protein CGL27_07225 [Streptomyces sp. 11-1-2]|nr:hypothetical protein CGL27_07225 [Streptomyces sp. 11-1-2]
MREGRGRTRRGVRGVWSGRGWRLLGYAGGEYAIRRFPRAPGRRPLWRGVGQDGCGGGPLLLHLEPEPGDLLPEAVAFGP